MPLGCNKEKGFSLIELMIALALSGIIIGAIYNLYLKQSKSYVIQDQVAEMQQNGRVAIDMIVRDIRMAGFRGNPPNAGVTTPISPTNSSTAPDSITIQYDDGSGSVTTVTYDISGTDLRRNTQPLAENIEDLQLAYIFADGDEDNLPDDGDSDTTNDSGDIRAVRINILARTSGEDPSFSGNRPQLEDHAAGGTDGYRRRLFTTVAKVRNLGL